MTFEPFARVGAFLHGPGGINDEGVPEVTWNDGFITIKLPSKNVNWMRRGACCRDDNGIDWFHDSIEGAQRAKEVCRSFVVQSICLEHAIDRHEVGVWGGTTDKERLAIRRTRRPRR